MTSIGKPTTNYLPYWDGYKYRQINKTAISGVNYDLLTVSYSTNVGTATPEVIGSIYFNPTTFVPTSEGFTRLITFEVLLESSSVSATATIDLYDYNGITNSGVPIVLGSSTLTTTNLATTRLTATIPSLATTTTNGIIEVRLATTSPTSNFATCKLARLLVTWS